MKKTLMILTTALLLGFSSASAAPNVPRGMGSPWTGGMPGCRMPIMQDNPGLNDKQCEQMEEFQAKHFRLVSAEQRKLMTFERELQEESLKATPDAKKIDQLAEKIGKQHTAIARIRSAHVTEMNSLLTPAQRDSSMKAMKDFMPMRGNCRMMMWQ
ncbi:MAG: Spy/CpxP family protein refolding chaperone [Chlorobium sp.]